MRTLRSVPEAPPRESAAPRIRAVARATMPYRERAREGERADPPAGSALRVDAVVVCVILALLSILGRITELPEHAGRAFLGWRDD